MGLSGGFQLLFTCLAFAGESVHKNVRRVEVVFRRGAFNNLRARRYAALCHRDLVCASSQCVEWNSEAQQVPFPEPHLVCAD